MNCFDCKIQCEMSNPLGYCFREKEYDEKAEPVEIITTTNTTVAAPVNVDAAMKSIEEKIKKATKTWEGVDVDRYLKEARGVDVDLIDAAQDLVDAVERYTRQRCLRSELMMKKDKLKELIGNK